MATTGRREAQVFVFRAGEGEYLVRPGTYIAHKSVGDHVIRNLTDDPVTVTFGRTGIPALRLDPAGRANDSASVSVAAVSNGVYTYRVQIGDPPHAEAQGDSPPRMIVDG